MKSRRSVPVVQFLELTETPLEEAMRREFERLDRIDAVSSSQRATGRAPMASSINETESTELGGANTDRVSKKMPDDDCTPDASLPHVSHPRGRYQVRYRGKDVEGAHFESLERALQIAGAYPDHTVVEAKTGTAVDSAKWWRRQSKFDFTSREMLVTGHAYLVSRGCWMRVHRADGTGSGLRAISPDPVYAKYRARQRGGANVAIVRASLQLRETLWRSIKVSPQDQNQRAEVQLRNGAHN